MAELLPVGLWAAWAVLWSSPRPRVPARNRPDADAEAVAPLDPALILDLVATAVRSGADLPRALHTVGAACPGVVGDRLRDGAARLRLGASWAEAWQGAPPILDPVCAALAPAWTDGLSPLSALESAAGELRRDRRSRAQQATSRLAVRLVLPLGLCFLPSFVLIGVVPVLLSLAGELRW